MNQPLGLRLEIFPTEKEMGDRAAAIVLACVAGKPDAVLGLATGSTPVGLYQRLIRTFENGKASFRQCLTFNLDEYFPVAADHDQSYHFFMHRQLFDHVDIPESSIHILNGSTNDPAAECAAYEAAIQSAGGIDLQVLGLGQNGHIAFNEPGTPFDSRTHLVQLDANTIQANSRFFGSQAAVPRKALTMGLATIMEAHSIVLLASGSAKANAIHAMFEGEVTPDLPASILQRHPDCTVLIDREAAAKLSDAAKERWQARVVS